VFLVDGKAKNSRSLAESIWNCPKTTKNQLEQMPDNEINDFALTCIESLQS